MLFFGYTHCPDICPTTLADMAAVMKQLGPDAARVQVLFVTVDPGARHAGGPREVRAGIRSGLPRAVRRAAATQRAAKEFRIFYEKRPGGAPGAYTVDHSAQSYVLDAQGRMRLFVRHDRIAQDLAEDLRTLLKEKA